jgi:hypothetical protein
MVGKAAETVNEPAFEENLAQRVVTRFSLSPPVDVSTVARHYANVKYWTIPLRVDGICLDLKRTGKRPTIIINIDQPRRRKRFTLAHELGHVLIPWHRGSLYDEFTDSQSERGEMEGEANRFASELLMPSPWISAVLQSAGDFGAAVSLVEQQADVSPIASVIRLISVAPPNHIFAYCDEGGVVLNAGRSIGTVANSPAWNRELDAQYLNRNAADHGEIPTSPLHLYWWRLADTVALPAIKGPDGWPETLNEILDDLEWCYADRHHIQQSINSVIGATHSRMRANSPEELFAALVQRFDSRTAGGGFFKELPHHPKFQDFLVMRVRALVRTTNRADKGRQRHQ